MESPIVWAEVDLNAIDHNVRELRRMTNPSARLMVAVKANAYGHGIIEVARQVLKNGADALGVARVGEGIRIREAGIDAPVLVFGYSPPSEAARLYEFDLIQTVYSYETARALSDTSSSQDIRNKIHLKVDTGMGRLGLLPDSRRAAPADSAVEEVKSIAGLSGLKLEGIFTHFATADWSDKSYAEQQFQIFVKFLDQLHQEGIKFSVRHAANSGAIIDMPQTHLDMVRAGISIYGLYPSDEIDKNRIKLLPAMSLKAKIIHLKKVPAGFMVSYGITHETKKPTTIATIPIGYGDGFSRLMSSNGHMLVHGQRAPIIGRVCMDLTMIDVGHIPEVEIEDEAVVFGRQGNAFISADEIASFTDTINYEVVTRISNRVPRMYLNR
ncbi:MAG: alanine racemase [Thermodesulfobacteriota bacterium]|nr:alanine racemase [Thermodesulfobacteriota bacterium]